MAQRSRREQWTRQWMKLSTLILFSYFTMIAGDEVLKSFDQDLTLPCSGCDHSQDCYSVINNNTRSTGSSITQSGSILLPSHTWNVYGSVCCGSDVEQLLLCHTVCPPQFERCEGCELVLSTNLSSVNDTIRVTKGEEITFIVVFTHQDHNAFTFTVNGRISHPNFTCTSVRDTNVLAKTLMVQYRCVVMELGTYRIDSYVTFCNFDYRSPTVFTVIVENTTSVASSTPVPEHSTSSTSSTMSTDRTVSSGTQPVPITVISSTVVASTVVPLIPTTDISVLPTVTTNISVTDATEDSQDEGNNTTAIIICSFTGVICVAVIVILALLLLKCISRHNQEQRPGISRHHNEEQQPDNSRHNQEQRPSAGGDDHPMGVTQYGSSRAVSVAGNTSNSGSDIVPSDFSTPYTGSAASILLAYPVPVMSEPTTLVPEDADTSHQFREDTV